MDYVIALTLLPPIWVTTWHLYLVFKREATSRPPTISEHAAEKDNLLQVHRVVHTMPILAFLPLNIFYLLPNGYFLAGILLLLATVFDSIESLTLNKDTASLDSPKNLHYFTAWIMAISYLSYMITISLIAGLSPLIYGSILVVCLFLLYFAVNNKYKSIFIFMQMTFFVLIAILSFIAHSSLLIKELA